jgi:subtilisin family serine protease
MTEQKEKPDVILASKLDPVLHGIEKTAVKDTFKHYMGTKSARLFEKEEKVNVIIDASEKAEDVKKVVADLGGEVTAVIKDRVIARVAKTKVKSLAENAAVKYVEGSVELKPTIDKALEAGSAIVSGEPLPYKGKGVIIGIIDSGIDWKHPDFIKEDGTSRILFLLDQEKDPDVEYTNEQINAALDASGPAIGCTDTNGHGTHVAGISAGNGSASNGQFRGVAPEADLIIVKTSFESVDIAQAVNYIHTKAVECKQPAVINLSLGTHFGPHDGTTLTERIIDDVSDAGCLVVVAAGNEGQDFIHAGSVIKTGDRWVADFILTERSIWIQCWQHHEDEIELILRSPGGMKYSLDDFGESVFHEGSTDIGIIKGRNVYSGDIYTTITIVMPWLDYRLARGWSIVAKGVNIAVGRIDMWIPNVSLGYFSSGSEQSKLVGMPGTSYSAITVASYATKREWDSLQEHMPADSINIGDISQFSSPGPTRENSNKPEIAAPGQLIASTFSSATTDRNGQLILPGKKYVMMQGTSMAAPFATGALALLLEKYPDITWAEAKRRLIKSCSSDNFTTPTWNRRWGYGKINVKKLLEIW